MHQRQTENVAFRGICDCWRSHCVLLYEYNASLHDDNEDGGGPVVSHLKSPPWFWAATNNPTRDYCTAGWRTAGHQFGPQLAVNQEGRPHRPPFTPSLSGATTPTLEQRERFPLGIQSGSAVPLLSSPPTAPSPLHPSQIKPLSDFCFPNLWTLTEEPTLERETTQHGLISRWQREAEKTLLKPPDHPVIFLFLCLFLSLFLTHL